MDVTIVMAQFGGRAANFEPSLSSYRKHFPDAKFVLYTDVERDADFDKVVVVDPPFDKKHNRYGYRCNDYYKVLGVLQADDGVAIAVDSDTLIVSDAVIALPLMAYQFHVCVPCNPRMLVAVDTLIGADSDKQLDTTMGMGYAMNMTPIAAVKSDRAERLLSMYLEIMEERPVRGPLAMWRAAWETGIHPYILPPQWCVCQSYCGIGNEIILHVGHEKVKEYYGV